MERDIRGGWVLGTASDGPTPDEYFIRKRGTPRRYFLGTCNSRGARRRAELLIASSSKDERARLEKEWGKNRNRDGKRTLKARRAQQYRSRKNRETPCEQ